MRFGLEYFKHDTPRNVKHIVDSINGGIAFSSMTTLAAGYPKIALAVACCVAILQAVSNLCAADSCKHASTCACRDTNDHEKLEIFDRV